MTEQVEQRPNLGGKVMPLFDHLHELRAALVKSILTVLVLFVVAMVFSNQIINIIKAPLMDVLPAGQKTIYFTGPMDVFIASLKVAMLASVVFGAPVWSYQFWKFLEPALYPTEKRYVVPFAVVSIVLFFSGVLFCYYVMLPMTLNFAIGLGLEVGTPMVTINDYISMVTLLLIVFGLAFETPVILVLLALLDLVDAQTLSKHRSVIIVGILIVSAVLTPPDPISQVAMALPMYVLYEISIVVIRIIGKRQVASQEQALVQK
jgi:sec-independent protein translocase protein TatC